MIENDKSGLLVTPKEHILHYIIRNVELMFLDQLFLTGVVVGSRG